MDKNTRWLKDSILENTKKSLEMKGYEVFIVDNENDAREKTVSMIKEKSTIGVGGSQTILQCGILDSLDNDRYNLLNRYSEGLSKEEILDIHKKALVSDYYITSTNAITENGELINLDGLGNRVAAMIFGPDKLIIISGENKITKDIDSAYKRVREYAAPINSKRLDRKTPCTKVSKCLDCENENRICNQLVVTYRQNTKGRATVILVKKDLGY